MMYKGLLIHLDDPSTAIQVCQLVTGGIIVGQSEGYASLA